MYVLTITEDYNITTLTTCTSNQNNTDVIIPALLVTIPCGQ